MTWSNLRELENILKSQGDESRSRENKVIATVNASEGKYAGGINMPMRRVTGHPNGVPIMSQPGGFFTANPVHAEEDPDEEAKALWKSLDADGDGDVSFEEFQIGMQEKLGPLCPKDRVLVDMYASFVDHHKSRIEDPDEAAKALWKSLDADGDEDVSFDEFRIGMQEKLGPLCPKGKALFDIYASFVEHHRRTSVHEEVRNSYEPSSGSPDRPSGGSLSDIELQRMSNSRESKSDGIDLHDVYQAGNSPQRKTTNPARAQRDGNSKVVSFSDVLYGDSPGANATEGGGSGGGGRKKQVRRPTSFNR